MSVKIGLLSDVHATPAPVEQALSIFRKEGVTLSICAGDIAGYGKELEQTLQLLVANQCHLILGNHDSWFLDSPSSASNSWVTSILQEAPFTLDFAIADKSIHVVHASPPSSQLEGIKLLDETGALIQEEKHNWQNKLVAYGYDVLIVGHTHQVFTQQLGRTLLINPGSTLFNHTCAVLSIPELEVKIYPLSNRKPLLSWNWGQYQAGKKNR
jgi:putative phosphoesterase